ncbi:LPXTG cell wall anchor domain-containing protein [Erysipelothrix rhusiopathiae]|nr:LPXTG cell wall anchor domain-containing protein [Erysipelothrix rhusiopathiae]
MSQEHIDTYKNSIQAIELKNDTHDLLIFANSITNKAHQKDDYRYVTNGIFTKYLGDTMNIDVKVPEPEPKPDPKVTLKLTGLPDKVRVGDVFVLTPSSDDQEKGEGWVYDDVFFSATFNSPATFTALKAGTTTITYTNKKGEKTELPITILEKEVDKPGGKLPGTGVTPTQTAIYVGIGVVLIGGVFYWFSKKKK